MTAEPHRETPYASGDERPPWIEEAAEPTYWDIAFGSYGDGYLEWVNTDFLWGIPPAPSKAAILEIWGAPLKQGWAAR